LVSVGSWSLKPRAEHWKPSRRLGNASLSKWRRSVNVKAGRKIGQ
jgi:hypothetical protein